MQGYTEYVLSYSELIEDQDSVLRQIEEHVLEVDGQRSVAAEFSSPEEGIVAWIEWMIGRGYCLEELPWCKLRGLGLVYSVTPECGGESSLYCVKIYDRN